MNSLGALIVFGLLLAVCIVALGKSSSGAKKINATGSLGRGPRGQGSSEHPILQVSETKPHAAM